MASSRVPIAQNRRFHPLKIKIGCASKKSPLPRFVAKAAGVAVFAPSLFTTKNVFRRILSASSRPTLPRAHHSTVSGRLCNLSRLHKPFSKSDDNKREISLADSFALSLLLLALSEKKTQKSISKTLDFNGYFSLNQRQQRRRFFSPSLSLSALTTLLPPTTTTRHHHHHLPTFETVAVLTTQNANAEEKEEEEEKAISLSLSLSLFASLCGIFSKNTPPQKEQKEWPTCPFFPYIIFDTKFSPISLASERERETLKKDKNPIPVSSLSLSLLGSLSVSLFL